MSRVRDLEIRGIRNFGDESAKARIHFSRPLTLILGPNGTGKTTIIEALKFITSGEYPPDSDRGKSFIHEPKLTQNHTVRGQVKAKIIDKNGKEFVVTRTMQVSRQKTGALKFQALDNTLTRLDPITKDKVQISSRCADIDREVLTAMGVSKPILNYVIFCHQEESNWPLEDGKKLKDRFDEIFDTSKYNKAMELATKFIKELQSDLNTIKAYEEGLKNIVDEVLAKEENLRDNERREQESQAKIIEIDESMVPTEKRMKEILGIKDDYEKLEDRLRKVETDYQMTSNYIESLKKHIKQIYKGSKEDLLRTIETYDTNLSQKITRKRQQEIDLEKVEQEETALLKKLADSRIEFGSLAEKKKSFDEKVVRRNNLLIKALDTWDIPLDSSEFTVEEVKDYIDQIENKMEEFATTMNNKLRENEQEEKYVQGEVDAARTNKTGIESEMVLKEKERSEINSEIKELKKKISQAGEDSNRLNSVQSNLQHATKVYDEMVQNFDEKSIDENLQSEILKKKDLDIKLSEVDQEINSLHQQSSKQAELELHQNSLKDKEETISSLKNKHKSNLDLLFDGSEIPQKRVKDALEKIQKSLTNEKNNIMDQIDEQQQKLTTLKTGLKYKEAELSKMKSELNEYKETVNSKCQDGDFNEILLLQERKVKSLQNQRGIYANQSVTYEEYLKLLKKKSCCPLCDRGFQNSSEEKQLEKKLYAEMKKSPENLTNCEKELKLEQTRYEVLLQLKPLIEQIAEIENNKFPQLKTSVEKTKIELEKTEENLENLRLIISEPEEKLNIYKSIVGEITLLDNHINDKDKLSQIIENKKKEMLQAGKIGDRSMQEAQNERLALKKRLISVESSIDKIRSTLQSGRDKVQKAREQKNKLNEEIINIRHSMQALKQLKEKVQDLYEKEGKLEKSVRLLRQQLVVAEEELSTKEQELNDLKRKNRNEQVNDMNFKSKSATEFHELQIVDQEVTGYINSKIEENLKKVELEVKKTKIECEEKKAERLELEERIRFLDEQCRSQETGKKDLENNLDLIKKQEDIEEVTEKITKYKTLIKNMQFDKLRKEYETLQDKQEEAQKTKSTLKGALGELKDTIKGLKRDLNQEKYRMARRNYKEKIMELVVQEQAIANLKDYIRILDKAMIQFHEERMNTVNKIMHKLWNLMYNGNDTSSIQIRVQTTEGIGDKRRSYNYKLVQLKRSAEMDMKGKCSAGQKVLASIIIRIALAETFCSECAVLALDEPTTNLDEDNATNLAVTLSKVTQLRAEHQKNFQLIVISHDEKFISHLSNLSGKQIFQELYRNPEGYSMVRQRDMSLMKTDSQDLDDKYDESEEDEKQDLEASSRKRILCAGDSPPYGRVSKRRAY